MSIYRPLVSIITVTYNAEKYLEQSIMSVLNQTYDNIEYIILDGKSNDFTLNIIKKFEYKLAFWSSEKDEGIYDAWNKGISLAKGEWIAFLNADDWYYPDAIASYIEYIKCNINEEFEYVSSIMEHTDSNLNILNVFGEKWNWSKSLWFMNVAHPGSFHHNSLFKKYGHFNASYRSSADYELLFRAGKELKCGYLEKITIKMRIGGVSSGNIGIHEKKDILLKSGIVSKSKIIKIYYLALLKRKFRLFFNKMGIHIYFKKYKKRTFKTYDV